MDDHDLAVRAAGGDHAAFEVLVRRNSDAVWRLARSLLRDNLEAEEAVQDTFVKAFRGLKSFRQESSFPTWLHSICYRTCIDRLRSHRAPVVSLDRALQHRSEEPSPDVRLVLEQTIAGLPYDERLSFTMVHVLGYTSDEASEICQVPASTVRSRVARARQRLADLLAEVDPVGEGGEP
jgi:RNA polymerase sigma-70 factor, ECF subfamily